MALVSTQPRTEMSTRNLHGWVKGGRKVLKADLRVICEPVVKNVGASTSHQPVGLHGMLQG
jgi:hypothetical protein